MRWIVILFYFSMNEWGMGMNADGFEMEENGILLCGTGDGVEMYGLGIRGS